MVITEKFLEMQGAYQNSVDSIDTLRLYKSDGITEVPVLNTGIAWPSDKTMKFRNPPNSNNNLSEGKR